jgi:hypothetical protein
LTAITFHAKSHPLAAIFEKYGGLIRLFASRFLVRRIARQHRCLLAALRASRIQVGATFFLYLYSSC